MTANERTFMVDQVSASKRSQIMARIKSKNTKPELLLRRALWKRGLRYRVNVSGLPGRPDIVFLRARIAVFVDGAFWHGKKLSEERLARMSQYWREKIRKNVERDQTNTKTLEMSGWRVLRYDDRDVGRQAEQIAADIELAVKGPVRESRATAVSNTPEN